MSVVDLWYMDVFAIEYGGGSLFGCTDVGGERGVSCSLAILVVMECHSLMYFFNFF